ncbi:hypothetical protein COHA_007321 [Chlorella ohadii]|uniref:Protein DETOXIFICATION n=1 Tax=Chlorella ohadii TaxID=2649997 RepID=A0AAD5DJ31_9CHLO|nr:hypothetical protein COHA_007321 [Chlorella ohadii]
MIAEELEEAAADAAAAALAAAGSSAQEEAAEGGAAAAGAAGAAGATQGVLFASKEVQEMLAFAVPALGMVLADPLMSLIDTGEACVGRVSSLQLAALGPNTALFNFAHNLFAFLGVATTNIIASNSLKAAGLDAKTLKRRRAAAERTLCNSLTLAVVCGLVVGTLLLTCGRTLLAGMGTAPELMQPAWEYLAFRALAAPAVLIMSVSQGACLGQQDAWTPFSVLAAAGLLNAVGDVYLISQVGMGVAGAAIATAGAQYLGAAFFIWHLWRKGRSPGGVRLRWVMREFLLVAATLFTRTIFGMSAYFSMTRAATQLGTLATAAHQVAMQTFWFLSYFPEPLSLTAQTLLARDRANPARAAHWARLLLRSGAVLGVLLAAAVGAVFTRGSWLFTPDLAVQAAVAQLAPIAMLALGICAGGQM